MGKDKAYLEKHLIPDDPTLWELARFDDFVDKQRLLINDKFKWLIF
jgi:hypothetical protein